MTIEVVPLFSPDKTEQLPENDFRNQLSAYLQEHFPDFIEQKAEDYGELEKKAAAREEVIADQTIEVLDSFGIETAKIERVSEEIYKVNVENHFSSERLPAGYAYKGGAARALLLRNLEIDSNSVPRDIDIVRISPEEPFPKADQVVAKTFMPDDFQHGFGVEVKVDQDIYFKTRDFTLNEVLATDKEIFATKACLLDTVRHIIRLTEYERARDDQNSNKLLAKALRFYSEAIHHWGDATLADRVGMGLEQSFISPFWLALQLDRAYEHSSEEAERYTLELVHHNQLPLDISNAIEATRYLANLMTHENFHYRFAPTEQYEMEDIWADECAKYDLLPSFRGFGKSRGDK